MLQSPQGSLQVRTEQALPWRAQEALSTSERELVGAQEGPAASDADWRVCMQAAADSAVQWKGFAERLGGDKNAAEAALAVAEAELAAARSELEVCARCHVVRH